MSLVKKKSLGSGNVWIGGLVGLVDDRILIGVKTKVVGSCALIRLRWRMISVV